MRKLIINADDFGLSPSVNSAVIECYRKGNITSATMMANMPGTQDAARLASQNPGLAVGLHFCLTEGKPLSRCPSLVDDDGRFLSRGALLFRVLRGAVDAKDVAREFSAQLERLRSYSVAVSHIDSHQHVLMTPWIFRSLLPDINAAGLPLRLVSPPISLGLLLRRPAKFARQLLLRFNSVRFRRQLRVRSNDSLVMIHDLADTGGLRESVYAEMIGTARGVDVLEVCVHPYILGHDVLSLYCEDLASRRPFLESCSREYGLLSARALFADPERFPLSRYCDL